MIRWGFVLGLLLVGCRTPSPRVALPDAVEPTSHRHHRSSGEPAATTAPVEPAPATTHAAVKETVVVKEIVVDVPPTNCVSQPQAPPAAPPSTATTATTATNSANTNIPIPVMGSPLVEGHTSSEGLFGGMRSVASVDGTRPRRSVALPMNCGAVPAQDRSAYGKIAVPVGGLSKPDPTAPAATPVPFPNSNRDLPAADNAFFKSIDVEPWLDPDGDDAASRRWRLARQRAAEQARQAERENLTQAVRQFLQR